MGKGNKKITYRLLRKALGTRLQRKLAVFITYKDVFENSCIYDWNYSKIARIMGDSRPKVKKYIDIFLARGWCREHCGHLVFDRIEKVSEKETGRKNSLIFHLEGEVDKAVHDDLFGLALYLKLEQCRKKELDRTGLDPDRRAENVQYKGEIGGGSRELSYKVLKRLWNVSCPSRIIRRLEDKDKIFVHRSSRVKIKKGYEDRTDYVSSGIAFKQPCNMYNVHRNFSRISQRDKGKRSDRYYLYILDGKRPCPIDMLPVMIRAWYENGFLLRCQEDDPLEKDVNPALFENGFEVNPLYCRFSSALFRHDDSFLGE